MADKKQTNKSDLKKISGGGSNPIGGPLGAKPSPGARPGSKPVPNVDLNPTKPSSKGGPAKL